VIAPPRRLARMKIGGLVEHAQQLAGELKDAVSDAVAVLSAAGAGDGGEPPGLG
jgi:hypothetical protein